MEPEQWKRGENEGGEGGRASPCTPPLSLSVLPEPESNAVNQSVERGHRAHRHERRISTQWGKKQTCPPHVDKDGIH